MSRCVSYWVDSDQQVASTTSGNQEYTCYKPVDTKEAGDNGSDDHAGDNGSGDQAGDPEGGDNGSGDQVGDNGSDDQAGDNDSADPCWSLGGEKCRNTSGCSWLSDDEFCIGEVDQAGSDDHAGDNGSGDQAGDTDSADPCWSL